MRRALAAKHAFHALLQRRLSRPCRQVQAGMAAHGRWPAAVAAALLASAAGAQVPPTADDLAAYARMSSNAPDTSSGSGANAPANASSGLFAAAASGDVARIRSLARPGQAEPRDAYQRTPLHVAAYARQHAAMRALVAAGADPNALERDRYDIVTIAAVANDVPTLELALALGCSARNITSRWDGTALIAAAHLGHVQVVRTLIRAGAPLDHVNNLGWTAAIESIVLGDGGARHFDTLKALVEAGANLKLADRNGQTPLALARSRGFSMMADLLAKAGG
jgi:ankyrin repeat protein